MISYHSFVLHWGDYKHKFSVYLLIFEFFTSHSESVTSHYDADSDKNNESKREKISQPTEIKI